MSAYIRRQRWEAKNLALEIWGLLGEAMDGQKSAKKGGRRRVPASEFLRVSGARL